jgi:hypothetical protein
MACANSHDAGVRKYEMENQLRVEGMGLEVSQPAPLLSNEQTTKNLRAGVFLQRNPDGQQRKKKKKKVAKKKRGGQLFETTPKTISLETMPNPKTISPPPSFCISINKQRKKRTYPKKKKMKKKTNFKPKDKKKWRMRMKLRKEQSQRDQPPLASDPPVTESRADEEAADLEEAPVAESRVDEEAADLEEEDDDEGEEFRPEWVKRENWGIPYGRTLRALPERSI